MGGTIPPRCRGRVDGTLKQESHPQIEPGTAWHPSQAHERQASLPALPCWDTHSASFLKPIARRLVGVPLVPFQTWVFQGSGWTERRVKLIALKGSGCPLFGPRSMEVEVSRLVRRPVRGR